jgi:hypothetical protein
MDEAGDVAEPRRFRRERMDRLSRGHVNGCRAHVIAGVAQDFGCGLGVGLAAIGEQHVLADSNTARDRLSDLSSADDDDDVVHPCPLSLHLIRVVRTRCARERTHVRSRIKAVHRGAGCSFGLAHPEAASDFKVGDCASFTTSDAK